MELGDVFSQAGASFGTDGSEFHTYGCHRRDGGDRDSCEW